MPEVLTRANRTLTAYSYTSHYNCFVNANFSWVQMVVYTFVEYNEHCCLILNR